MKPRISSQVDHDWRHYEYVRDSKLPYGTFGDTRRTVGDVAIGIVCALAVLAFVLGWIGQP